jgi:hypothetical protein
MKRLLAVLVGVGIALGSVSFSFAQDTNAPKMDSKKAKKNKKNKKSDKSTDEKK